MRDYATVSPVFWTGQTGRRLKQAGPDAMLVAMYLVTSPHSNAMGLFYLPTLYIAHETGLSVEGATKALARACEEGFCAYDADAEVVWVFEMARFQIGQSLSPKDNRVKWVNDEYGKLPKCRFLKDFFDKYASSFHLKEARGGCPKQSPLEAPSESLRSQDQEQEQEQEKDPPIPPMGVEGGESLPHLSDSDSDPEQFFDPEDIPSLEFEQFFDAYPKQVDKAKAWNAWRKLGRVKPGLASLQAAIVEQSQSDQWTRDHGRYIPSPAKWLAERKWLDKLSPAPTSPAAGQTSDADWKRYVGSCVKEKTL